MGFWLEKNLRNLEDEFREVFINGKMGIFFPSVIFAPRFVEVLQKKKEDIKPYDFRGHSPFVHDRIENGMN